jgi:hypothetical protein
MLCIRVSTSLFLVSLSAGLQANRTEDKGQPEDIDHIGNSEGKA